MILYDVNVYSLICIRNDDFVELIPALKISNMKDNSNIVIVILQQQFDLFSLYNDTFVIGKRGGSVCKYS